MKRLAAFFLLSTVCACTSIGNVLSADDFENSLGEASSSYSYIPIDPFSVKDERGDSCGKENPDYVEVPLPDAFPDNNVRIAYKTIDLKGNVSFGPIGTTQEGYRYQIIIDFINVDVANEPFRIKKYVYLPAGTAPDPEFEPGGSETVDAARPDKQRVNLFENTQQAYPSTLGTVYEIERCIDGKTQAGGCGVPPPERVSGVVTTAGTVNVPVYIGVGLRVIADVIAIKGETSLSGLDVISSAAENGLVTGSLTVQTLGINGKSISAALPIPSELNRTTVQSAIAALGAIKALMYEGDVRIEPRAVGIYNPIGGGEPVINAIISELSGDRIVWNRPCEHKPKAAAPTG